ncbi:hypothetical protein O1L44_30785 [Streptomyces noursei]|nr:hypothetical protein SNOUR_00445 [Streptomyces noursei ATCC 11455]ANZ21923.1 ATP-grasp domain [Streptomyces noursei ATCC 11455]MCZ0996519.1 hypothetical protein [Streptomyces noursei]
MNASSNITPAHRAPTPSAIVIVAPTSAELPTCARQHNTAIAVHLPPHGLPLTHATELPHGCPYAAIVQHVSLRRTFKELNAHHVTAVLAGSAHGINLAEQIAAALGLPTNGSSTAHARQDRHEQAQALRQAALPAPCGMRTTSLTTATRWMRFLRATEYVLTPANTSVAGARICRSPADVRVVWPSLQRTARNRGGGSDLVLQERLAGPQYVLHTHTHRDLEGAPTHTVTSLWASTRTASLLPDRDDQLDPTNALARSLTRYLQPVLDRLGVRTGPARTRIVLTPDRGPILLSLQTTAEPPPTEHRAGHHTTRITLIAPEDAVIDGPTLRTLTCLPTVSGFTPTLTPGAPVTRTIDADTSPGALTLTSAHPQAITDDHHTIRRAEARGLYHLARRPR